MKFRRSLRWLLAGSVAATFGTAYAGPEECLTLRDNVAVAGCADKFAPGTPATAAQTARRPTRPEPHPEPHPVQVVEQSLLFPVPTAVSRTVAPKPESPAVIAERDRSELVRRGELGAVGLAGLGLVFGLWRWRASTVKKCSYCGTRVAPGVAVCKRCFRAV